MVYEELTLADLKSRCIELTVWDYDKLSSNEFLGGVRLCLGTGKRPALSPSLLLKPKTQNATVQLLKPLASLSVSLSISH